MAEIPIFFISNRHYRLDKGQLHFSNSLQDPIAAAFRAGYAHFATNSSQPRFEQCELYPERQMHTDPVADGVLARADLPPEQRVAAARQVALERAGARIQHGSNEMMLAMQTLMAQQQCDALVFIHGFALDFMTSLHRLHTVLQQGLNSDYPRPLGCVFAWPAEGRSLPPLDYYTDRQAAELSGRALARSLCRLVAFLRSQQSDGQACARKIHLLVHGMGAWVLRHALRALQQDYLPGRCPRLFDQVVLIAADETDDALEQADKLANLLRLARRVHVYYSRHDLALESPPLAAVCAPSLGQNGPRRMHALDHRVVAVDCQAVSETEASHGHHQYFWARREVVRDLMAVFSAQSADHIGGRLRLEAGRYRLKADQQPNPETPRGVYSA